MATTAATLTSPGNRFDFYGVRATPSGAVSAKVFPVETVNASGKLRFDKPARFIKTNFRTIGKSPLGTKASLGGNRQMVSRLHAVRAALECGYGPLRDWSSTLVLSKTEALALKEFLLLKLEVAVSCVESGMHQERALRSFFSKIELSEKASISFILGGIGTYIAARKWLEASGQHLRSFMHVSTFTKAKVGVPAVVDLTLSKAKTPDYLAISRTGNWHAFESKGGAFDQRWQRIVEGLSQLEGVDQVGWAGSSAKLVESKVCVHTTVEVGRPLQVTAVDPPGQGGNDQSEGSLTLMEEVCRLLEVLQAIDSFHALRARQSLEVPVESAGITFAVSGRFGGLDMGIPRAYLERESEVRNHLGVFLAVKELLDAQADSAQGGSAKLALLNGVLSRVEGINPSVYKLVGRVRSTLVERSAQGSSEAILAAMSDALELKSLAEDLSNRTEDAVFAALALPDYLMTTGGLLLRRRPA
jgi:hypothetical protein